MNHVYLGVDLGTSSVKCLAMNLQGQCLSQGEGRYPLYAPKPGWVEQNPDEWMEPVYSAILDCLRGLKNCEPVALSFSGHMSSLVVLDDNFAPLLPCSLVGDTRASKQADELKAQFGNSFVETTGNVPWQAFIVSKLLWIKQELPDIYRKINKFIVAKDYIRYKMTGELCTDYTDAGNTLLYNPKTKQWDDSLIAVAGLNKQIFPRLIAPTDHCGAINSHAAQVTGLPEGLPVICGAADMACSQIGTGGVNPERLIITLSTSGQMCMNVNQPSIYAKEKITFHPGVESMYAMASVFSGGLAVNWGFSLLSGQNPSDISDFESLGRFAKEIESFSPGQSGITFLPFLTGSGSPHNNSEDKAHLVGMTLSSDRRDVMHAIMEGVAYNLRENSDVFRQLGSWKEVRLGGGGANMKVWRHIIADVLGVDLNILQTGNASAVGACILAMVGIGAADSVLDLSEKIVVCDDRIEYDRGKKQEYDYLYEEYRTIYKALCANHNTPLFKGGGRHGRTGETEGQS